MTYELGSSVLLPSQRRPVAWYAPRVLGQAARDLLSSTDLLPNLDRRETFPRRIPVIDLSRYGATAENPFWFDFIADKGDGGNATCTIADGALRQSLINNCRPGPRSGFEPQLLRCKPIRSQITCN